MIDNIKVICLVGADYWENFSEEYDIGIRNKCIILINRIDNYDTMEDIFFKQIDLADELVIINHYEDITDGVKKQIKYAESLNKSIKYISEELK